MEADRLDQLRGPLPVAAGLAAVAGFLDAHIYVRVTDVFVANMSGNVVLLGIGAGELDARQVAAPAVALAGFSLGLALATLVHDRRIRAGKRLRPDLMVALEVAVLAVLAGLLGVFGGVDQQLGAFGYVVIGAAALAMGAQTAVIRRVGDTVVSTTYESGAVVRLSEDAVLAVVAVEAAERARRRRVLGVVSIVVVGYCAGAAAAAAIGTSTLALLVPAAALVACAAALRVHVALRAAAGEHDDGGDERDARS